MRQILSNLISNAIKFTDRGSIVVHVVSELQGDDHMVKLSVTDTGHGISPEVLDQLFQAFTQFDSDARKKFNGTGLGLFLCKKLATLMGGHIGVHSTVGKGSEFWFSVKMTPSDTKPMESKSDDEAEGINEALQHRMYRAMVVEDNIINQKVMIRMLEVFVLT